ncbi:MAG: hypothetical protein ACT4N2_01765 [Hyphomicrobium sp.]
MSSVALPGTQSRPLSEQLAAAPLWALSLAALLVYVAMEIWAGPSRLLTGLGDSDDATRLVAVRDLLAGAPWFDTTLSRIGAPEPLVSHWSRLVDLPLAALIGFFDLFVSRDAAELAVRAIWPFLVLLPLLLLLARHAERQAGRVAAILAMGFAVYAHTGVVQFTLGRIDHHNVMIVCVVGGLLLLSDSFRNPRLAHGAGALLGLGTAFGYEALALTVLSLSLAALFALWRGEGIAVMAKVALAFAATLVAAFVLTTGPSNWLTIKCDALSANLVVLAAGGALGLFAAARPGMNRTERFGVVAMPALGAFALYAVMEPACLAGPFGQVDPAVFPIWLSDVQEVQSLWQFSGSMPQPAAEFAISALIGIAIAAFNLKRDRGLGAQILFAVLVLATLLACWQVKLMPYATFLAVPPLAIFVARLKPIGELTQRAMYLLGFALLNQHTILLVIMLAADAMGSTSTPTGAAKADPEKQVTSDLPTRCLETSAVQPLAALPPGLMLTDADFGPFIVALTGHRVVSAPYHRLDHAILETEAIKSTSPADAARRLAALGIDYVVICKPFPPRDRSPDTFAGALHTGRVPAFLAPVSIDASSPYLVWRFTPPIH